MDGWVDGFSRNKRVQVRKYLDSYVFATPQSFLPIIPVGVGSSKPVDPPFEMNSLQTRNTPHRKYMQNSV